MFTVASFKIELVERVHVENNDDAHGVYNFVRHGDKIKVSL